LHASETSLERVLAGTLEPRDFGAQLLYDGRQWVFSATNYLGDLQVFSSQEAAINWDRLTPALITCHSVWAARTGQRFARVPQCQQNEDVTKGPLFALAFCVAHLFGNTEPVVFSERKLRASVLYMLLASELYEFPLREMANPPLCEDTVVCL